MTAARDLYKPFWTAAAKIIILLSPEEGQIKVKLLIIVLICKSFKCVFISQQSKFLDQKRNDQKWKELHICVCMHVYMYVYECAIVCMNEYQAIYVNYPPRMRYDFRYKRKTTVCK